MTSALLPDFNTPRLITEVYALLERVLTEMGSVEDAYVQVLHQVLNGALASEGTGSPLSALTLLCCQVAQGESADAVPAAAAWRALHIAAKLLDDVEDGDVLRTSSDAGAQGRAINLATGFIALANLALTHLRSELRQPLSLAFQSTILQMAGGQHIDLSRRVHLDVNGYLHMIGAKSGVFFGLATLAGARCATADPQRLVRFEQLGYNIGMLVQIVDDLVDWHRPLGQGDLAKGQNTLPVCYALSVAEPPLREQLMHLLPYAPADESVESEVKNLIAAAGADIYMLAQITLYKGRISTALTEIANAGSIGAANGMSSGSTIVEADGEPLLVGRATPMLAEYSFPVST